MTSSNTKTLLLKIVSMFSVVRGYNVFVIALAQYLASIFILSSQKRALAVLLDYDLFLLVLASSLSIASGYIINNFYDSKKDLINRPNKTKLDQLVSQKTKLQIYFSLNFLVAAIALLVSFRAFLFFSFYIFVIWFYSHKLKKIAFVGNLTASALAVLPFFAILLYYKNWYSEIGYHAIFLYALLLIREIIKDLENIKGDIANNYQTIPVKFGENFTKKIITIISIFTIIPIYFMIEYYNLGYMDIYFYFSLIALLVINLILWKSSSKSEYLKLHNALKIIIVLGVFCIVLIQPQVIVHAKNLFNL